MPAQQVLKRGGSVLSNQNDQTKHERFGYAASQRRVWEILRPEMGDLPSIELTYSSNENWSIYSWFTIWLFNIAMEHSL
jgi:hypothetical protein